MSKISWHVFLGLCILLEGSGGLEVTLEALVTDQQIPSVYFR